MLSAVPGEGYNFTWFVHDNINPQNNRNVVAQLGPSVAMNSVGDRIVMVHTTGVQNDGVLDDVYVREFTTPDGYHLTQRREFFIESSTLIGGWQRQPTVSMNSDGTKYVVVWRGSTGAIRAASVDWNSQSITAGPMTIADDITANGKTYDVYGPISVSMRQDGLFAVAWNSDARPVGNPFATPVQEAQARVFNTNLTTFSSLVTEIMPAGWARDPVVAWSNHGNGNWDVFWYGQDDNTFVPPPPPGGIPNSREGHYLQKYNTTAVKQNQLFVIPRQFGQPQNEWHYLFAISNDPAGNVAVLTKVGSMSSDPGNAPGVRIRVLQPTGNTYQAYPGLPANIDNYPWNSDPQFNSTALGGIDMDAAIVDPITQVRSFSHFIVGSQKYVEGPHAHWAWFDKSNGGVWTANGPIAEDSIQDMFVSPAINRAGNWWAFGYEFFDSYDAPASGEHNGWSIRIWDPPVTEMVHPNFAVLAGSWSQFYVDRELPALTSVPELKLSHRTRAQESITLPLSARPARVSYPTITAPASNAAHDTALLDLLSDSSTGAEAKVVSVDESSPAVSDPE